MLPDLQIYPEAEKSRFFFFNVKTFDSEHLAISWKINNTVQAKCDTAVQMWPHRFSRGHVGGEGLKLCVSCRAGVYYKTCVYDEEALGCVRPT